MLVPGDRSKRRSEITQRLIYVCVWCLDEMCFCLPVLVEELCSAWITPRDFTRAEQVRQPCDICRDPTANYWLFLFRVWLCRCRSLFMTEISISSNRRRIVASAFW